jgi:uncharacterized protein with HEPN domain
MRLNMSKKKRDFLLFLEDVIFSIEKIEKYTKGLTYKEFARNDMAVDAVIRNFEIIGEAVKKVPMAIKKKYTGVEWNEAAGFRDVLVHDYFGIDLEAVWDTINKNIPSFKMNILRVLNDERGSEFDKREN